MQAQDKAQLEVVNTVEPACTCGKCRFINEMRRLGLLRDDNGNNDA
jgi:hypothetical protein